MLIDMREMIEMQRKEMESIDFTEYVGRDTVVDTAEVIETKFGLAIKLTSKQLDDNKDVKASTLYSVQYSEDDGYYIGVGSKLDNFLVKKGLTADMLPDSIEKGMVIPVLTNVPVKVQMNVNTGYLQLF